MNITFFEPRFHMSAFGRMAVRVVLYSVYGIGFAVMAVLLLSDIPRVFWAGTLLALFFADRIHHLGKGDESLHSLRSLGGHWRSDGSINAARYLAPATYHLLERAYDTAVFTRRDVHISILEKLVERREIRAAFFRIGVDWSQFHAAIATEMTEEDARSSPARERASSAISSLVCRALAYAIRDADEFILPHHLFSALGESDNSAVRRLFALFRILPDDVGHALFFLRHKRNRLLFWVRRPFSIGGFGHRARFVQHRIMNRAWTARPTPTLDSFGIDLTDHARDGRIGFLIGHEHEYDRLVDVMSRLGNASVILVGDPGIGKETIVAHLARQIVQDTVPEELFDKRLVLIQLGPLTAGAAAGELRQRVENIIDETIRAGNVILYIPEIHSLMKTAGAADLTIADMILPLIANGQLSVIGASYPKEFRALIQSRTDFSRAFELIRVEEISEQDTIRFLVYQGVLLEWEHRIVIQLGAITRAVQLAHAYFHQHPLPASALRLLTEAFSDAVEKRQDTLTPNDIIAIAERQTNIPLHAAQEEESVALLNLEDTIHKSLVDQEYAVRAVSRALREYRSGLHSSSGPIAVFLFVGPTGVGKTELAKILANVQFGSDDFMVRFDMSEYQTRESIYRFIGSQDGTVLGTLTEAVSERPYSLILLDEFEKAHAGVLNLFLQVFDDGRLTDGLGRTVDFSNTVIVATSNALSEEIISRLQSGGAMDDDFAGDFKKRLTAVFRPELINRFTDVVVFKSLSPQDIYQIAKLHLNKLRRFLEDTQGIKLLFSEDAVRAISELGYSATFGARPLKNAISEHIRSELANLILQKKLSFGSRVNISFNGDEFVFSILG